MDQEAVRPRAVILVEGESDRIALATLAGLLKLKGIEITSMGGVTNTASHLRRLGPGVRVAVLCDQREAPIVRRHAERTGVAVQLEVCEADLEDELIRALGPAEVEKVIAAEGELDALRSLQQMPQHRGSTVEQQLRRFIGTKAGRKARLARALVEALEPARVPAPLKGVLAYSTSEE